MVSTSGGHADLHAALAAVASVCDYAHTRDDRGFDGTDTVLGHMLAALDPADWTDDMAVAAHAMLGKYRRQLADHGIDYDRLAAPDYTAADLPPARDAARRAGRAARAVRCRAETSFVVYDEQMEAVVCSFDYAPDMVAECRGLPGRAFRRELGDYRNVNVFPFASLPAVVDFADRHGMTVPPETRAARPHAEAEAAAAAARPHVTVDARAGGVRVDAEYDPDLNAALKAVNDGRSTWDRDARTHRPPVHKNPDGLAELIGRFGLRASDDAHAAITAEEMRQAANLEASVAETADPVEIPELGVELMSHQHAAVRFITSNRRMILGDAMGLGKTASTLAAAAADHAFPAVVVCKPDLVQNWAAEAGKVLPRRRVIVATGTRPAPDAVPADAEVVIIGFAALAAVGREASKASGGEVFPWVDLLTELAPAAFVLDEGQFGKEISADRSRAMAALGRDVAARGGLVVNLTGTAVINRVRELTQQLAICDRLDEFGGEIGFKWRYCDPSNPTGHGWVFDGQSNLPELHHRLRAWGCYMRRRESVLNLPPFTEHVLTLTADQLDREVMEQYRQAEDDTVAWLANQAEAEARRLGCDPADARVKTAMKAQAGEQLVRLNTLRHLAGRAKQAAVADWTRRRIADGEKVMIAAHHRDVVDALADQFGGLRIQGGQSSRHKEADKAAFQTDPEVPAITVSITAGGVGHTLHAARLGIQAELCWTPGEKNQMGRRLHRIGQTRPVDYHVAVAEGTIDEVIWQLITGKQQVADEVLDGAYPDGADPGQEQSMAADAGWVLVRRALAADREGSES